MTDEVVATRTAQALLDQGAYAEAVDLLRAYVSELETEHGSTSPNLVEALEMLAFSLNRQLRCYNDQEVSFLERALAIAKQHHGPDSAHTIRLHRGLAITLHSGGHHTAASAHMRIVVDDSLSRADGLSLARTLQEFAEISLAASDGETATRALQKATEVGYGRGDPRLDVFIDHGLARAALLQNQLDEAIEHFERALDQMMRRLGPANRHTQEIVRELAEVRASAERRG